MEKQATLWTKDFSIITGGSVVSMLGNSIAGFAMGLLVLDLTGSTFLYAIYMFLYTAPRILMPILSGPFLDKFSRKKTIYTLDFISAGIYLVFALVLQMGFFHFWILALGCVILGCVDSVYRVAYESFYPMLITEGNYSKAYSVSSVLETLTTVMIPVSAVLYNMVGIVPLFVVNAVSFLVAAIMETKIKQKEEYSEKKTEKFTLRRYKEDFMEGVNYLKVEKGLWAITLYFAFSSLAMGASSVITLPYFKNNFLNGEFVYIYVWGCAVLGRMIGGSVYYKFRWPAHKKFYIALFVYAATCLIEGTYLFTSVKLMMVMCFVSGLLGVTSYNIRISATQSYVPDERKGRFNGTFEMMMTLGMMIGELAAGGLTFVVMSERIVLSIFMGINFLAALLVFGRNKKHVAPIYNRHA